MAYYITINKGKEEKKLDISTLSSFVRKSKFKKSSYSLEEIDSFTSLYDNEVALKKELYEKGIINIEEISKELSIKMAMGGKLKKVHYDLIYSYRKKYLDIYYLKNILLSLSKDRYFINKLVQRYRNSYVNTFTIADIRNYALGNTEINIIYSMENFFVNEVLYKDKSTGEIKIKYRSLHDLSMFVCNYIETKENTKLNKNDKIISLEREIELAKLQKEIVDINEKKNIKKKVLNKNQVEGQISLFDY